MGPGRRLTGLQRQVLSFYRDVIRVARSKDPELKSQILQHARNQIEENKTIERRNVMLVEHLLRKGKRQLEILDNGSIQGIGFYSGARLKQQ